METPGLLHLDFSKVLPRQTFTLFTAFIPGVFFELSVAFGNPEFVGKLLCRQPFPPSRSMELGIALFLAFFIGNVVMSAVSIIQLLLCTLCRFGVFLRQEFCEWPLAPIMKWLITKRFWQKRMRILQFRQYVNDQALLRYVTPKEQRDAYTCWRALAHKLLQTRYGVDLYKLRDPWVNLYWSVGTPTAQELRGSILVMAIHAAGWCGLAATLLAPALRSRYYVAFCVLMVGIGIIHDFGVARRRTNPMAIAFVRIQALLREYQKHPDTTSDRGPLSSAGSEISENLPSTDEN